MWGWSAFPICSVHDGIYALGKAHMRSIPSLRFPNVAFEKVPMSICLTDDVALSSFEGRSSSASTFHSSLLQVVSGAMSLALCPQAVSLLKLLNTSEKQATCEGCLAHQSNICSVVSLHSGMSRGSTTEEFSKVDVDHRQIPVLFFIFLLFHHRLSLSLSLWCQ